MLKLLIETPNAETSPGEFQRFYNTYRDTNRTKAPDAAFCD